MFTFHCKPFADLSLLELYDSMALRQEVFIVEQNCPYLDADGKDKAAWHLLGYKEQKQLIAYARLLPKGVSYEHYVSIGRIVSSPSVRRTGAGKALVQEALNCCNKLFPNQAIKISAQQYLLHFYESFGFVATGEEYLEDGIPHVGMIKR